MKSFVPQEDDVDLFSDDEDAKEDQIEDTTTQSMDAVPVADAPEKQTCRKKMMKIYFL